MLMTSLSSRAIKLLRRGVGCHVGKVDAAEVVGHSAQSAPSSKIGGFQDGVNSRRPSDSKLECSNRRSWLDELNRQRISEYADALLPQRGNGFEVHGQIRRAGQR